MGIVVYSQTESRNVAVNCRHCGNEISFVRPWRLGSEVSLKCFRCERRMFYTVVDLHTFNDKSQPKQPSAGLLARLFG
jgi:hypothetical protein